MARQPFNGAATAAPHGVSAIGDHMAFLTALAVLPSLPRWQLARIANRAIECIDLIDGDPDGHEDDAEDAFTFSAHAKQFMESCAGCPVADPGGGAVDDQGEDEYADLEREQMLDDVPCLPVYAIEPDASGKRRFLGMNGPESFRGNPAGAVR